MTASGDVADYTPAVKDEIKASAAANLGVPASDVTVTVLSASVIIRIEIATTSTASTAIMSTLQGSYSGTSGGQALLSGVTAMPITVESAPTTAVNDASSSSSSDDDTVIIAAAAGGGGAALVLIIVVVLCMCQKPRTQISSAAHRQRSQRTRR
jgi:hypothetical protein